MQGDEVTIEVFVTFDEPLVAEEVVYPFTGMTQEWYLSRSIVLYRLTAISPDIVENWADRVMDTLGSWDKSTPYRALHDLSHPGISLQYAALVNFDMMNIGITIEGRILAERLFDEHPDFTGRVGVNFNLSLSGQTNRTLMNYLNREHSAIRYKTFYNQHKALRWLNGDVKDTSELNAIDS